jgi:hypothetical protein
MNITQHRQGLQGMLRYGAVRRQGALQNSSEDQCTTREFRGVAQSALRWRWPAAAECENTMLCRSPEGCSAL